MGGPDPAGRASEDRAFRFLAELASDWFWEQDSEFRFTRFFGNTTEAMHRNQHEFLGQRRWELPISGVTPQQVAEHIATCQRHEPFHDFKYTVPGDGGALQYYSISGMPVFDAQGGFTGYMGVGRNLTELRLVEIALGESVRQLSQIVDGSPIPAFVIDADHRVTHWNRACEQMTGLKREQMLGRNDAWTAFYPEQRPLLADLVVDGSEETVIAGLYEKFEHAGHVPGAVEAEAHFPHLGKDGKWIFFTAAPLRDSELRLIGAIETLQDITRAKAFGQELLRINHLYDMLSQLGQTLAREPNRDVLLQEICDVAVTRAGFHLAWVGLVDQVSSQVRPVAKAGPAVGYLQDITVTIDQESTRRGLTGTCIRESRTVVCQDIAGDPAMAPWVVKAAACGLHAAVAVPILVQGLTVGALTVYAAETGHFHDQEVALLKEAAAIISVGLDRIAMDEQRKILESELAHAQKMESLGSLAGGVAHDINNVLGAILSLASLHAAQAEVGSDLKTNMDTITRACHRGGNLVKGLLGFARQRLAEERVLDLNQLVQEQVALLEPTALKKIAIVVDLAQDLLPIKGDCGALSHALLNLCVNAVEAMAEGGTLTLISQNSPDGMVFLEVVDTGTGMTKEILDRAMDPFFTTKPEGKGIGLGLSIVYGTVKAHRGKVVIQSEPGEGTRVALRFPSSEIGVDPDGTATGPYRSEPLRHLHILLVDDDELIRSSIPELIQYLGHTTTTAASGEGALAKIKAGARPDVVILDVNMPGLGGARTLPLLRALLPTVPVILATGRADQEALDLLNVHAQVTLSAKPFGLRELQHQLETLTGTPG